VFVEGQAEDLVLGTAGFGKRRGRGDHALSALTHAGAAVHEQPHGDQGIVAGEKIDRLRCAVLDDPKRISGKVGHVGGLTVGDGHVHDDEFRRRREDWSSFLSRLRPTAGIDARDRPYRQQHNRSNQPPSAHVFMR
jgi:hypothetical protein